jgi:hypothetical protein
MGLVVLACMIGVRGIWLKDEALGTEGATCMAALPAVAVAKPPLCGSLQGMTLPWQPSSLTPHMACTKHHVGIVCHWCMTLLTLRERIAAQCYHSNWEFDLTWLVECHAWCVCALMCGFSDEAGL